MINLKEDLNAYLNRNDATKSTSIPVPFHMKGLGKFFGKADEEENEDLLTNNVKYYRNFECCPPLSRFQRIVGFGLCLFVGTFFFGVSLIYVPLLALKARKFALMFSLGSVSYLSSLAFLWGPINYLKHIFSVQRLPFTITYFSSLMATLYFSVYIKSSLITAICAAIQIIALVWYLVTYIPGGQTGFSFFRSIFSSAVTSTVSRTLPV